MDFIYSECYPVKDGNNKPIKGVRDAYINGMIGHEDCYFPSGVDARLSPKTLFDNHTSLMPEGMLQSRYPCN